LRWSFIIRVENKFVLTVVGKDRPGIVATVSNALARFHANIIKARASTIFSNLFVLIMVVDTTHATIKRRDLINILKHSCDDTGLALSVESADSYRCEKRVIVFDLDGTLIEQEVIEELARAAGVFDKVARITALAMEGKTDFSLALKERVWLLKGLPVDKMDHVRHSISIFPGVTDLVKKLKEAGFIVGIVTGGFDFVANHVGEMVGADYVFSNRLGIRNGVLTGEVEGEITGPEAKFNAIRQIAAERGVGLESCVAVGDGANDLLMMENVGLGVGFKAKLAVREKVSAVISTDDLNVLLALIGCIDLKGDVVNRI
jgi:phosphoserine phosphatase